MRSSTPLYKDIENLFAAIGKPGTVMAAGKRIWEKAAHSDSLTE